MGIEVKKKEIKKYTNSVMKEVGVGGCGLLRPRNFTWHKNPGHSLIKIHFREEL